MGGKAHTTCSMPGPNRGWIPRSAALTAAAAVLFLAACENPVSPTGDHEMYFPNTVGSQWHYQMTFEYLLDTSGALPGMDWSNIVLSYSRNDTLTLSLVGEAPLDSAGGVGVEWQLSQRLDTLGFLYDRLWVKGGTLHPGDTLAWYIHPTANRPAFYFVAPLQDGQEWVCTDCQGYFWDPYSMLRVERVPILVTPAGRFLNVYKFSHTFSGGDEYGGWISLYLADRVGIVKLVQETFSGGSPLGESHSTLTWQLREYDLE